MMQEISTLWILIAIIFVLFIASFTYVIVNKISILPYTVVLTIIGIILHLLNIDLLKIIKLSPESVLLIFLPILLFESAFNFDFRELKRILIPSLILATLGLILSATVIALLLIFVLEISFPIALMFGCIISSTDPIAVLSFFKQLGVSKKLQLLVEGESLLNDASSIIFYKTILNIIGSVAGTLSLFDIFRGITEFTYLLIGGIIVGAISGYVFSEIIYRIKNVSVVEITLTIILAHLVFILADDFIRVSGIISVITAAIVLGNYGRTKISPQVMEKMHDIWNLLVFLTTSIIFILIGYEISLIKIYQEWLTVTVAIVATLIGRSIAVYGTLIPYNLFTRFKNNKIPYAWMHILNWGGLRGALPIVMILSLPDSFSYKETFLTMAMGIIFFTLVINATTIKPLIQYLGINRINKTNEIEIALTEVFILRILKKKLKLLKTFNEIDEDTFYKEVSNINDKLSKNKAKLDELYRSNPHDYYLETDKILRRYCLQIEKGVYAKLFARGVIPEIVYSILKESINLQIERINEGEVQIDVANKHYGSNLFKVNLFDRLIMFLEEELNPDIKIISLKYKFHKARLLGDQKVLKELKLILKQNFLPRSIVQGIISLYQSLKENNLATIEEIRSSSPETTRYVEKLFAQAEIKYYVEYVLKELGEEERISPRSLQCIATDYKTI